MRLLQPRDVVVGQIGPQRRADDLARAAGGFDEGVAQAFERAVDGVGEGKSHAPIMSWRTCHSSGARERGFTGLRRYGLFNVCHRYQLATVR